MIQTTEDTKSTAKPGAALQLAPSLNGWCITAEGGDDDPMTFNVYEDALKRACDIARQRGSALYVRGDDEAITGRWEFYAEFPQHDAIHVVPSGEGWAIRRESEPMSGYFERKLEAVDAARKLAKDDERDLVVHYTDGEVQGVREYAE